MATVTVDREALGKVIEYLWHDEERHFAETEEAEEADDHIFVSVARLAAGLMSASPAAPDENEEENPYAEDWYPTSRCVERVLARFPKPA